MKNKDIIKYTEEIAKGKIKCKCGHSVVMPPHLNKIICHWCGNYVFRNSKFEFEYRLREKFNKK